MLGGFPEEKVNTPFHAIFRYGCYSPLRENYRKVYELNRESFAMRCCRDFHGGRSDGL